jgi:ankyrin repeat protein
MMTERKLKTWVLAVVIGGSLAAGVGARANFDHPSHANLNQRLTRATEAGDVGEMRHLLSLGADPNFRRTNAFKYPLLLIAITRGQPKAVELLLRYGANPEATDLRGTPILVSAAALSNSTTARLNEAIAALILRGHVNPNARDHAGIGDGRSALHLAAENGSDSLVQLLLSAGADPNVANRVGETPLHFAASHGHLSTVRTLLAHGARVGARSRFTHITPVMAAAESGYPGVVELLIERRADISARNTFGDTPLSMARTSQRKVHDPELETRYRETIRLLETAADES